MIFPSGNAKNLNGLFNPITDDPRSPSYEPELKKNVKKAKRDEAVPQPAQKFSDVSSNLMGRGRSVGSAQCAGLSDLGGPVRQMKVATSNTIWDNSYLERLAKGEEGEITKGEQIKSDNAKLAEERKALRKQSFTIDKDAVLNAMRPSNAVMPAHAPADANQSNYSNKVAGATVSLFQSENPFDKLPERTPGEMIAENAKARKEAKKNDRSWETVKTSQTTRDAVRAFFNLSEEK